MSSPLYDEVGSRTRQAWLRTGLGVVAVTLLILRGLALSARPAWLAAIALVPACLFVGAAVVRTRQLRHGESDPASARTAGVVVIAMAALMLVGAASVVAGQG